MSDTVIVAIISFLGTLLGAYIANRKSAAIMEYRLEQLEKKVDKHNTVIERTYALEKRAEVFEEKIKVANKRILDLEEENRER
ncbi:MAG: hypothetical protein Q4E35_08315 [Eubacteriales bacterium]|nr:hypothetical protein [Eubacteriales bacterium]